MNGKLRNMSSIYIFDENDKVLLLYRIGSKVIKDSYIGTAGGHFEESEINDAKRCILRELEEETNLKQNDIDGIQLRYVTLRLKNEEIRQNYYFFAKLKKQNDMINSNEGILKWFNTEELKDISMPHTAKYVIEHYIKEGRYNDKLYAGIAIKSGLNFTELNQF